MNDFGVLLAVALRFPEPSRPENLGGPEALVSLLRLEAEDLVIHCDGSWLPTLAGAAIILECGTGAA